jgi:hypothetical protein
MATAPAVELAVFSFQQRAFGPVLFIWSCLLRRGLMVVKGAENSNLCRQC